jgi:outer membrane protein assembly factor BamB
LKRGDTDQRLRWLATPDENRRGAMFEGAPLVHDGRVYIAATRVDGGQTITAIHCYPANAEGTARSLWKRDVCTTQELGGNVRYRHHLLTLAGSRIVYCSHSGAIVALDADSGKNVWAVRYSSHGGTTQAKDSSDAPRWERDLTPAVYAAGRLFVAPADDKRLLCLDPANGATLWERGGIDIVHLLGVTREKLILTTPQAIRALDATTGTDVWQMPDVGTFLAPVGRGLLADDLVFWPTSRGLKVLQVDDGRLAPEFPPGVLDDKLPAERLGNMIYADGCLVIAGTRELAIYLAPGRQRAQREDEVRARPTSAEARLDLAIAEEDAGFPRMALDNFRQTEKLATTTALADQARASRHTLLLEAAAQAEAKRQWDEAAQLLDSAAAAEFTSSQRATGRARLASVWTHAADWSRATEAWQAILDEAALRYARVEDRGGNPQSAGVLATIQIDKIMRAHGLAPYAPIEDRARRLLETVGKVRSEQLRELAAQFPNAAVTRTLRNEWERAGDKSKGNGAANSGMGREAALELPLSRAWDIALGPAERLLIPDAAPASVSTDASLFLAAMTEGGGRLACRDAATGSIRWSATLPFVPSWLGYGADAVLAGGSGGVAALHPADGRLHWTFLAAPTFSAFQIAGSRLFVLEGGQRLIALEVATGEVSWARWAPAAGLGWPSPSGQFNPNYHATNERLLLQIGGGRRSLLDATTGRQIQQAEGSPRQWMQKPLALDCQLDRVCVTPGPNRVALLNMRTGNELWRYDVPHRGTMTGELPQVLGDARTVYVLIHRNYGMGLQRLDAATGRPIWSEERLLSTAMLSADCISYDDRAVYYAVGNVLHAHSLADGRNFWQHALAGPSDTWRIRRVGDVMLAWPVRIAMSIPLGDNSIESTSAALFPNPPVAQATPPTLPLAVIDIQTGQLLQRLNFPPSFTPTTARKMPYYGSGLNFLLSDGGLIVGVPGKACRFATVPASAK